MNKGDVIICRDSNGYMFTRGKEYTVVDYQKEEYDETSSTGFTWPPYVVVKDDGGRTVFCHASRFIPKEPNHASQEENRTDHS